MSVGKSRVLILILAIVAIAVLAYYFIKPKLMTDKGFLEIAQAPIWSDLQGIEFQHRTTKDLHAPILIKGAVDSGEYDVLGVSANSSSTPFVWIVLNTNAGVNGIYAMPNNVDYKLSCPYLHDLATKEKIDNKVMTALQSHCTDSAPAESGSSH
jgi:hypothetical protein